MEEARASGMFANTLVVLSLMLAQSELQYIHSLILVRMGRWVILAVQSQPRLANLVWSWRCLLRGASFKGRSAPEDGNLQEIDVLT